MSSCNRSLPTLASSLQAVEKSIHKFRKTEDFIKAFQWLNEDQAREEARFQDQREDARPLAGMVIGIKDLIDTAAAPTTYGSAIYQNHKPAKDALIVSRLRDAGAVPFGKTVTTEFALFNPPKTRNPWNLEHTPGGSSSGSAAAVAAGVVPVALGTQTAGSIIRPAAFCGIFGFKPSFNALPSSGLKSISPSLDTVGLLARNLIDVCTVFQAIRSEQPKHQQDFPKRINIAFMRTPWWLEITHDIRSHTEDIVRKLAEQSEQFVMSESSFNTVFGDLTSAQQVLMGVEVLISLERERRDHASNISKALYDYFWQMDKLGPTDEVEARNTIQHIKNNPDQIFGDAHIILSPAALTEAPTIESTGDPLLCRAWTALGIPCISLPIGVGANGLPIGLQLAARPGEDDFLLAVAVRVATHLGIMTAIAPPTFRP